MNLGKRPPAILVLSFLYMAIGTVGFAYHFPRPLTFHYEDVWIEGTELLAFVAGVFMLRGHNWARWLALAWVAFHVAISFPVVRQMAIHALLLAAIAWLLFESRAEQYFASKAKDRNYNSSDRPT